MTTYLTFLRRTSVGPYTINVIDTKLGRQTSTIHVTLKQDNSREEVVGYITFSNLNTESGLSLPTKWSLHPPPPSSDITKFSNNNDPNWELHTGTPYAEFRKATARAQFVLPRSGQPEYSIADEWIRFSNGERFTTESLGYVVDMSPQIVEGYRGSDGVISANPLKTNDIPKTHTTNLNEIKRSGLAVYWYPTLLLNLEIKKLLPPEGVEWLFVRFRAKQIQNGRMDMEVVVLDEGGDIVALSQHVALIVGSERNLAQRSKTSSKCGESKL